LHDLRQGQPIEDLEPTDEDRPACFILNPIIYKDNPTVIYGPGDSYKSFFCLYLGMLMASGICGPGLAVAPTPWKVLFLDWEMTSADLRSRVKQLRTGDQRLIRLPKYRRCYLPMADEVEELRQVVEEGEYDVLIIDSLAMAAGGQELERADSATRFFAALRSLNCTSLIVGHTPKPQEGQKELSLYGSVFFRNLCRNQWECRRDGSTVALYHRKHNLGPEHAPLAFDIDVTNDHCLFIEADVHESPLLSEQCPLPSRIESLLKSGKAMTASEIAGALGVKLDTVRRTLQRHKGKKWIQLSAKAGEECQWATL
jgi:hypothetical protein